MEFPPPGLRSLLVLDNASMMKLGLFEAGEDGRLLMDTNLSHHGLDRIRNPLNFNPNTGLFLIDTEDTKLRGWTPCHPDEIAIPTYFVSYETLVFVGFTKTKALELWESYKMENDAADKSVPTENKAVLHQNTFRILRHAQRYLKANARHATTFKQLQDIGFDNSTVYVGFQPSRKYTNGSPALDTVDVLQPAGDKKLLAWALRTSFRRFIFLSQLNAMLECAELEELCAAKLRPTLFHWKQLITLFETNENRGNFLPEDDDSFDSETTDTDTEGSDVVELYAEKKEGALQQEGATSKVEKKPGTFLTWESSTVEKIGGAFQHGATSKGKIEEGVFPDKDTLEAETPRPFSYYPDEEKKLRDAAHHYFDEDPETPSQFLYYSDEDKKLSAAHRYFDDDPEMDMKAPAVSLKSEKVDKDNKPKDARMHYLEEELEKDSEAPSATLREAKKSKMTDAELMPPPPLPARFIHVPKAVTKNEMDKVNQKVGGRKMKGKKGNNAEGRSQFRKK